MGFDPRTTVRRLRYRTLGGVLVLRYHRVAELPSDPHAISVRPDRFRRHLEILRANCRILGLGDLERALAGARPPRRGVVLTFDDGYADNLTHAKPLLEEFDIPAIVFVVTGYVGGSREFWWDELEALLLRPGSLPRSLHLSVDGRPFEFELGEWGRYHEVDHERHRGWSWRSEDDPTSRHLLFRRLFRLLQVLRDERRRGVLEDLAACAGGRPVTRPSHRILTADELIRLTAGGLIEVGAHSVTHPLLTTLSETECREEIHASKTFLEDALGAPVVSFAYPYGVAGSAQDLVREAGFRSSFGTDPGIVFGTGDPFQVPRSYVGDWDVDEFWSRIERIA